VYQSFADGQWDLWVMNADGTNPRRVTGGAGNKTDASFSPDGQWIVYSFEDTDEDAVNLYVISTQGGQAIRVTNFEGYDGAPSWSPDGRQIVFESSPSDPDDSEGTTLWVIAAPSLAFDF
jgi:TolB protein